MMHPDTATLALKEWAVAVKALAEGAQVLALRKGGIHREDRDFRIVHPQFLLFPTFEHQKAELLKPGYHGDLRDTLQERGAPAQVTISYWTEVTAKFELRDESALDRLSPFHIWTGSYARKRLHWRPKQPLTVALLRVYRLQEPQAIPLLDEYEGCKSWVDLGCEVPLGNMVPVLDDSQYEAKAASIGEVIGA
jgi:hypothetical protein